MTQIKEEFLICIPELDCYVRVFRNAIPDDVCKKVLLAVQEDCIKRYPIKVFDNIVLQPRCNCLYSDVAQMDYSNSAIPSLGWRDELIELKDLVSSDTFHPNSCLVNGYINVDDRVGLHRDKDLFDGSNFVCTVSLGGTRRFIFRRWKGKIPPSKLIPDDVHIPEFVETELNEGDVVYMYGNTNFYFEHEIAKYRRTKDSFEYAPRYSCTFRVIECGTKPICETVEEMKQLNK